MSEPYQERQENEIQVLHSIYVGAVKDLRKNDTWNVPRPPEVLISLKPTESMSGSTAHVSVDLYLKMPTDYPDSVPFIDLKNSKGISNQQINEWKPKLEELAQKLKGEVMVLELAELVRNYLHDVNKPPSVSFYDEMLTNQQRQKEKLAEEFQREADILRKKEEEEMQKIDEKIQEHLQALKETNRQYRQQENAFLNQESFSSPTSNFQSDVFKSTSNEVCTPIISTSPKESCDQFSTPNISTITESKKLSRRRRTSTPRSDSDNDVYSDNLNQLCEAKLCVFTTKKERSIFRGKCLGHNSQGSTVYSGMDIKTGELVCIREWVLKWKHPKKDGLG